MPNMLLLLPNHSHGIRLICQTIVVDGKKMNYTDVLKHPLYQKLLCDEDWCDFYKYAYQINFRFFTTPHFLTKPNYL